MKTLHLSIITTVAIVMAFLSINPVFAQDTPIPLPTGLAPVSSESPLIINQVELYGPTTNQTLCGGTGVEPVQQWFELYNSMESTVSTVGYGFTITHPGQNTIPNVAGAQKIEIGPHQKCVFELYAIGGPAIDDPRNVIITFTYQYDGVGYTTSTPPLTDTYNDTRTWQLIHGNWTFMAPSPYQQLESGVPADGVVCNQNFVLLSNPQHAAVCVEPSSVSRLESIGWIEIKRPEYIPVIDETYFSGPGYSCRFIFPHLSITNSSGFHVYNDSEITHYALTPGHNGTLTYKIFGTSYGLFPPIYSPSKVNVTNSAYFYYDTGSGRSATELNSLNGVTITYEPKSELVDYDGSSMVTANISANSDAKQGKYGIDFVPGGCAGASWIQLDIVNDTLKIK